MSQMVRLAVCRPPPAAADPTGQPFV